MGDNLISRCKIAAKDCLLYNTEKVSEYGKIYMEAADRIAELEAQLDEVIKGHLETGKVTHKRIAELAAQLERINMCAAVRLDDCPDMSRLEYVVKLSDIEAAIKDQSNE